MFKFSKASEARFVGVDPELVCVCKRAIQISRVDFGIPPFGGYRSAKDQKQLFDDGASKCDGVKVLSKHQSGRAIDVFAYVDGKESWEPEHLTAVAAAMLQAASELKVSLQWGGHWTSFRDLPHFELMGD